MVNNSSSLEHRCILQKKITLFSSSVVAEAVAAHGIQFVPQQCYSACSRFTRTERFFSPCFCLPPCCLRFLLAPAVLSQKQNNSRRADTSVSVECRFELTCSLTSPRPYLLLCYSSHMPAYQHSACTMLSSCRIQSKQYRNPLTWLFGKLCYCTRTAKQQCRGFAQKQLTNGISGLP